MGADQGCRGRRITMSTRHIAAVTVLLAAAVVPVANAVIIHVPGEASTSTPNPRCSHNQAGGVTCDEIMRRL